MGVVFVCNAIVEFVVVDGCDNGGSCRLEVLVGALKVLAPGIQKLALPALASWRGGEQVHVYRIGCVCGVFRCVCFDGAGRA